MTSAAPAQDEVTFEQFCEEWLREFTEADLSPFEKGQRFAFKLVTQWLNVTEDDEDLVLCDGTGDGGIDIAYLHRADLSDNALDEQSDEGDTWYLIQSKYGTAFQGQETIISEGRKVIRTVAGENDRLSEHSKQLQGRIATFIEQASERDKLILVFATVQPMKEEDRQALNEIRTLGRERFPRIFDVEDISFADDMGSWRYGSSASYIATDSRRLCRTDCWLESRHYFLDPLVSVLKGLPGQDR